MTTKKKTDNANLNNAVEYRAMSRRERALCGTLCLCLGAAVMSSVALVYLTVIIYLPAQRELSSGFGNDIH